MAGSAGLSRRAQQCVAPGGIARTFVQAPHRLYPVLPRVVVITKRVLEIGQQHIRHDELIDVSRQRCQFKHLLVRRSGSAKVVATELSEASDPENTSENHTVMTGAGFRLDRRQL